MDAINCDQCGGLVDLDDALYDEHSEQYFCDRECFLDWADDHFDEVTEFYEKLNLR